MCSPRPSASPARLRAAGFTLIELMVGMLIGLLATLAVTHVLVNSEGQKRTTTSGSDAQVNGALALGILHRAVQSAGYGFTALPAVVGCPLVANYGGAPAGMPGTLVPVMITDGGAAGASDTIRVLSSGKRTFSVPLRVTAPGRAATETMTPLVTTRGVEGGDLMIVATDSVAPCEMFRVTAIDSAKAQVTADDSAWDPPAGPGAFAEGAFVINMGVPLDVTYEIEENALRSTTLHVDAAGKPAYDAAPVELFNNVVNMQALYGKDSDGNGSIDRWDVTTPATNADWLRVVAVRVALVARSDQFEKEDVTFVNPDWDVGAAATVDDSTGATAACGTSKCLKLKIDTLPNWKRYRYRVFDTVIPLRNMLWNS